MKTILILTLFFSCTLCMKGKEVYYTKKGGVFNRWFRDVTQKDMNNGDTFMFCSGPGVTKCKPQALLVVSDDETRYEINDEKFEAIDELILSDIKIGRNRGRFIFDNSIVIVYKYNEDLDEMSSVIYTIKEAQKLGLI